MYISQMYLGNSLAHHKSLRSSAVRAPTGVWEVMGSNPVGDRRDIMNISAIEVV